MAVLLIWYVLNGTPTYIYMPQPSEEACVERLIQFLEDVQDKPQYQVVDAACAPSI